MQMTRRWAAGLLALAAAGAAGGARLAAEPQAGKPAPAFSAPTVDTNKKVSLAQYKGKSAVLLNFYFNA